MLNSNGKNYLKRTNFINSVDSNKLWSKSLLPLEIKDLLDYLEKEIDKYDFEEDKNFLMDGRRNGLKIMIEERLEKIDNNTNEYILE